MTYLITGGAGFVGSHVAEQLLTAGKSVVIIDNFNDYYDVQVKRANIDRLQSHSNLTVIEGDIRDVALVNQLFEEHQITHVGHLAAMAGVRSSMTQPHLYMDVNVTGTLNLLEAAKDADVKIFVFASTSSVYGKTQQLPFIETDTADHPLASYPASKRSAELLAHTYHHLFGMNVTVLRFFNVYGPAGRPDMMPMRLMHASQDGTTMKIFNQGEIQRDWTYIEDTVKGFITALERPLGYEVINLGCGKPISLTEFVQVIEEYSNKTIKKEFVPAPPSEPPITFCNNEKARKLLDFSPEVDVYEGLRRTWEWFRTYYQV